jgi:hypothetical protein
MEKEKKEWVRTSFGPEETEETQLAIRAKYMDQRAQLKVELEKQVQVSPNSIIFKG